MEALGLVTLLIGGLVVFGIYLLVTFVAAYVTGYGFACGQGGKDE